MYLPHLSPDGGRDLYEKTDGSRIDLAKAEDREIIEIRHQEMGYVSQFFHVLPRVPAIEILMEPLIERGTGEYEARARAEELLSYVDLEKHCGICILPRLARREAEAEHFTCHYHKTAFPAFR